MQATFGKRANRRPSVPPREATPCLKKWRARMIFLIRTQLM
jgi:hypothetical protein